MAHFLRNQAPDIAAMDLFVVPMIGFDLLYAVVIVRLDRRNLVWINVTTNPTAEWVARQITEAFPWNEAPRYMIRDRDHIYGAVVTRRLRAMGIRDRPIAPAWIDPPRVPRSCHRLGRTASVSDSAILRKLLQQYENASRPEQGCSTLASRSANRNHRVTPDPRRTSSPLHPALVVFGTHRAGNVVCRPILGGLHHQYCRI